MINSKIKFLIVGDLHGEKPNIHFDDFDAIIVPGDICGDRVKEYHFEALKRKFNGEKVAWYDVCGKDRAKKFVEEDLEKGRDTLEFLNSFGKPIFVNPGNWEYTNEEKNMPWDTSFYNQFWDFLNKNYFEEMVLGLSNVKIIHHKMLEFKGINIIGYGINSGPEFLDSDRNCEFEKEKLKYYDDNFSKLDTLFKKSKSSGKPTLFVSHNVPYLTKLDEIRNKMSPRNGRHYGSVVARNLILKHKPILVVGSHIHENFGQDRLNEIPLINAGFGKDCNTRVSICDSKVVGIEFAGILPEFP